MNRAVAAAASSTATRKQISDRLRPLCLLRPRPLPAFHLLTTEAPGLVESFIQTSLEEEVKLVRVQVAILTAFLLQMALHNVIRAKGLEDEVQKRISDYEKKLLALGWKVIQEFGYEPIVEQFVTSQGYSKSRAVLQVVSDHAPIQEEVQTITTGTHIFACTCSLWSFSPRAPAGC
jgi:hypothetical protein